MPETIPDALVTSGLDCNPKIQCLFVLRACHSGLGIQPQDGSITGGSSGYGAVLPMNTFTFTVEGKGKILGAEERLCIVTACYGRHSGGKEGVSKIQRSPLPAQQSKLRIPSSWPEEHG